jgi:serine phosphatase RsbU (regulator of sigma subunit)
VEKDPIIPAAKIYSPVHGTSAAALRLALIGDEGLGAMTQHAHSPAGVVPEPRALDAAATDAMQVRAFSARDIAERVTRPDEALAALSRQYRILDTLRQAASQLVVHRPLPELFELLLDLLFAAVPAQRGAILLRERNPDRLELKASRSRSGRPFVSVSRAIASRVLEEGNALLLDDALRHPAFSGSDSIIHGGVRSAVCAPLWFADGERDEVVGVVYLDTASVVRAFDEEDLGLVTAIASVAAVKIHTARLLKESLDNRRLQEEVRLAAELQAGLLPQATPALPGFSLGAASRPCHAMGGDYYDWQLAPGGLRLALADVSGKGAAAALLMAAVRALVRASWGEDDLARAAAGISRAVFDNVPASRYATAFLARLDPSNGRLAYVNAGHHPPVLVRADGTVETLASGGFPLGLVEDAVYQGGATHLAPGDVLLAFSDGVCEARDAGGRELGVERLVELARSGRGLDAPALAARIERAVAEFSGEAPADDDRTLLVLARARA